MKLMTQQNIYTCNTVITRYISQSILLYSNFTPQSRIIYRFPLLFAEVTFMGTLDLRIPKLTIYA